MIDVANDHYLALDPPPSKTDGAVSTNCFPRIDVDNDGTSCSYKSQGMANLHRARKYLALMRQKSGSSRGRLVFRSEKFGSFEVNDGAEQNTRTYGSREGSAWTDLTSRFEELQISCREAPHSNWKEVNILCDNVALAIYGMLKSQAVCQENIVAFTQALNDLIDSLLSIEDINADLKNIIHDLRVMILTDLVSFATSSMPTQANNESPDQLSSCVSASIDEKRTEIMDTTQGSRNAPHN